MLCNYTNWAIIGCKGLFIIHCICIVNCGIKITMRLSTLLHAFQLQDYTWCHFRYMYYYFIFFWVTIKEWQVFCRDSVYYTFLWFLAWNKQSIWPVKRYLINLSGLRSLLAIACAWRLTHWTKNWSRWLLMTKKKKKIGLTPSYWHKTDGNVSVRSPWFVHSSSRFTKNMCELRATCPQCGLWLIFCNFAFDPIVRSNVQFVPIKVLVHQ